MFQGKWIRTGAIAASLATVSMAADTHADVQDAIYIVPEAFSYKIRHMPDLDQRRFVLPGLGGMYCVPTATMNLFAYAANHGFPTLSPGARNWQLAENYNTASDEIFDLGELMGTHPTEGTGSAYGGAYAWLFLDQAPLTVSQYYSTDTWFPKIQDLVKTAVQTDSIIAFAYGRYFYKSDLPGFTSVGERTGGHMVTLSEAHRFGSNMSIGIRDPADEAITGFHLLSQSPFSTRQYPNVAERLVFYQNGTNIVSTIMEYPPTGTTASIIDSYLAIRPMQGYGWSPAQGLNVTIAPNVFLGNPSGSQQVIPMLAGQTIVDAALSPEGDSSLVIVAVQGTPNSLVAVDHTDGAQTAIAGISGAQAMAYGRNRELYILQDEIVSCMDIDSGLPNPTAAEFVPGVPNALTYSDVTDQVIVLSPATRQILLYESGLPAGVSPTVVNVPFPFIIPMEGQGALAVNPVDGQIWFVTEASNSLFNVTIDGQVVFVDSVSLPIITDPKSMSFSDNGDMFVMTSNGLVQLRRNGPNQWSALDAPLFDGLVPALSEFAVTCSRTNFDPKIHSGPGYNNFLPEEDEDLFVNDYIEVDCDADINGDGVVNGADLASLLAAWGSCDVCLADVNGDRIVNGTDLANLLSAFGPCPVFE